MYVHVTMNDCIIYMYGSNLICMHVIISTAISCIISYQCFFCVRFRHYVQTSVDTDFAVHRDVVVVQLVLLARRLHLAEVKGLGLKVQLGAGLVDDGSCRGVDSDL